MRRTALSVIVVVSLFSWAPSSASAVADREAPASASATGSAVAGLVAVPSDHDVATTADRLVAAIEQKGARVFARIDHGANAASVGSPRAPMQLVIFGRAEMGTALMRAGATVGIDLPLKVLE